MAQREFVNYEIILFLSCENYVRSYAHFVRSTYSKKIVGKKNSQLSMYILHTTRIISF